MTLHSRFFSKFQRSADECWVWEASITNSGYGRIREAGLGSKTLLAHRVSWEIHYGKIEAGILVLHRCDVRRCVNPRHLFLGTYSDNAQDRQSKGRGADQKGENNPARKLNDDLVREIRSLRNTGNTYQRISNLTGIPRSTVVNACLYTWKHLGE